MPTGSISLNVTIGGVSVAKTWTREADHPNPYEVVLPVAQEGDLTTRTDDDTGVVTMDSAEHGIITSDLVDVYWAGGMRYGMVATVAGQAVTLDGGLGDALPAQDTAVTCCVQVVINTEIDGDQSQLLCISLEYADSSVTSKGHVDFQDADTDTIAEKDLEANKPLFLDLAGDVANPLTGDPIIVCYASHGDPDNEATLKILTLDDATP